MKSIEWKTYRTRFLVKAKQLNSNFSFVDSLGRQHSGRKGDYLVESSDGVISITPRRIFEDIYVAMIADRSIADRSSAGRAVAGASLESACSAEMAAPIRKLAQTFQDQPHTQTRAGLLS